MTEKNKYSDSIGQSEYDDLMEARLEFRNLLEEYGLTELTGGESDAIDFLENEITKIADTVARRERFLRLIREARDTLNRQAEQQGANGDSSDGERDQKPHPSTGKRFRRFTLANTGN
jgi:hypothetical protein